MNEEAIALARILRKDQRYSPDAYFFIREALSFAADKLELRDCHCEKTAGDSGRHSDSCSGASCCGESDCGEGDSDLKNPAAESQLPPQTALHHSGPSADNDDGAPEPQRHVTGQQLCEGIREYAISQFGLMSKVVLNSWGIQTTSDFGEIVYNLIRVGVLKKSSRDRRSHFNDVYDFEEAFDSPEAVSEAFPSKLATLR